MKTYNIQQACSLIGEKAGGDPIHTNTLLAYRGKLREQLSETARPDHIGPVILSQSDIDIISELYIAGKAKAESRKQKTGNGNSPFPKNTSGVISSLEAESKQHTAMLKEMSDKMFEFEANTLSELYSMIEDQAETIKSLENKVVLLEATFVHLDRKIEMLNGVGMALSITEMSKKLDKVLSPPAPRDKVEILVVRR